MRRLVETYRLGQTLSGRRGQPGALDLTLRLEVDLEALVRQLAAAAHVSKSKPKRSTIAHGAVVVTIVQEGQPTT
jgi:hypothetical protein